jgi:SAM-dependent MidA family methyltransferase
LDILSALQRSQPKLLDRLSYGIIEPSPRRQTIQRERLTSFQSRVTWHSSWEDKGLAGVNGIIFSNELLDAFPIHRIGWDKGRGEWFEWGVENDAEGFRWTRLRASSKEMTALIPMPGVERPTREFLEVLPDGFTIEVAPSAGKWWQSAASALEKGYLLAIDYALLADEIWQPERLNGTARAYSHHHVSHDLLANPGEQDLTAHVDYSMLQRIGEEQGLQTAQLESQAQFLARIVKNAIKRGIDANKLLSGRARQFQTLTHPEFMGRPFRVLVQKR